MPPKRQAEEQLEPDRQQKVHKVEQESTDPGIDGPPGLQPYTARGIDAIRAKMVVEEQFESDRYYRTVCGNYNFHPPYFGTDDPSVEAFSSADMMDIDTPGTMSSPKHLGLPPGSLCSAEETRFYLGFWTGGRDMQYRTLNGSGKRPSWFRPVNAGDFGPTVGRSTVVSQDAQSGRLLGDEHDLDTHIWKANCEDATDDAGAGGAEFTLDQLEQQGLFLRMPGSR